MTSVCVSMIVKNEARVVARCLRSLRPHITHFAIVDTGSSDRTRTIIRREMRGVPGQLLRRRWIDDFAFSRNQALDAARTTGADFALFVDADEIMVAPGTLRSLRLTQDCYTVTTRLERADGFSAMMNKTRLVRAALPWRWEGAMHERLVPGSDDFTSGVLSPEYHLLNREDGGSTGDPVAKSNGRVAILRKMIAKDPTDTRAVLNLAQELRRGGRLGEAISAFEQSAAMRAPGEEEAFLALFLAAQTKLERGDTLADVVAAFRKCSASRPGRAEPLVTLAHVLNAAGLHRDAVACAIAACQLPLPQGEAFFPIGTPESVKASAIDELGVAMAGAGQHQTALDIFGKLLAVRELHPDHRAAVERRVELVKRMMATPERAVSP